MRTNLFYSKPRLSSWVNYSFEALMVIRRERVMMNAGVFGVWGKVVCVEDFKEFRVCRASRRMRLPRCGYCWDMACTRDSLRAPWYAQGTLIRTIDYRCEDGRFLVSTSCVTISNPDSLCSCATGVNLGIRSWKKHLSEWARCQKAIGGIYFTKQWRAETLQPGLEFDNFIPWLESCMFKCISWLNGSVFLWWWSGFSERGSQDPSNGTNVFFCLHIYSLW